jgi:hypothetical protein
LVREALEGFGVKASFELRDKYGSDSVDEHPESE